MKTLTLLLCGFFVTTRGYLIKVPTTPGIQPNIGPVGWVHYQKLLLPLFENVCDESKNPTIVKLSQDFKLDTTNADFSRPEIIKNLVDLKTGKGLLPKGKIFTEYKTDYLTELKVIYELFYYANDFSAFYKAACWARQNINCGLFIDALYSAILNRKDTKHVYIPAPYEILPNYFIRKDFIIRASKLIADGEITPTETIRNDGNAYILDVNYTTNIYEDADESKLAYFYEDIGLNSYYYLTKMKMTPWMHTYPNSNKNGEYLYTTIKQLMARYNLERYSNGLPEIEGINWDDLNTVPYYDPMLVYSNGNEFSRRTFNELEYNEKLTLLKNIENNIETVVMHMRENGFSKSDILNHLMEMLMTSEKSYENLALQVLSNETTINNRPPSVLEHYMTTLRDPAFWIINKKMVDIVDKALKVLPGYSKEELYFPGVEILNVEVKKMSTSFDNFIFDVTDALKMTEDDTKFKIKISQTRLTNKPFTIKVNITSLVSQKGLLRIYLGPKILPGEHALKKNLFMLLDCSEINLKFGSNIITRTSADMTDNSDDFLSLYTIRKKITDAEFGLDTSSKLKLIDEQIKFPSRLIIPKGLPQGLPLQLFIFVVPYGNVLGGRLLNSEINKDLLLSPGFPLDLDVEVQQLFDLPNALVKDILVTHKESGGQNVNYGGRPGAKSWQNNDYIAPSEATILPLGARPDFTMKKDSFDYKSKRGQYGKNPDYAAKKNEYKYKKDYTKVIDKPVVITDDKNVANLDTTTNQFNKYVSNDMLNKDNFEFVITTDRSFDGGNTFNLDKKIQDNGINEEVHLDIMGNEKKISDNTVKDFGETLHKVVIDNGTIEIYDKVVPDKSTEDSGETIWKKINKHEITDDTKVLPDMTLEDSDEKTNFHIVDKNKIIDIYKTIPTNDQLLKFSSDVTLEDYDQNTNQEIDENDMTDILKTVPTHKRFPTLYDIVMSPFNGFDDSYEKVYE